MGKSLVILGGGVAGLPIAHHVLKHTVPLVKGLKVTLVTPNADHYWNLASVRGVVPGQFSDTTLFTPIEKEFAQYPRESWEIVNGKADILDTDNKTVTVLTNNGARRSIDFDSLVIATGTRSRDNMPWKEIGMTEETKQRLHELQDEIKLAKSVLIAGGGTTGAEVVGEVAFEYGKKGKKVYWVIDKPLPLDDAWRDDVRRGLIKEIEKLGGEVITSTRAKRVPGSSAAKGYELELTKTDGTVTTMTIDAFLPTTGLVPNSTFVPAGLRDDAGYVHQDETLRVPGHENIFVVGDIGNLEVGTAAKADAQLVHTAKNLHKWLTGAGKKLDVYKPDPKLMGAVTSGRSRGTGQVGTWKLPSLAVWFLKGRYLGTDYNKDIAAGRRTMLVKGW